MSWPAYAKYRNSGIGWIGEVPSHWPVAKVKHGFSVVLGKMYQAEMSKPDDELLPHVKAGSITEAGLNLDEPMMCAFSSEERISLDLRKGDLLVVEGGAIGRCVVLEGDLPGWGFQKSVNRVRPRYDDSIEFLRFVVEMATECGHVSVLCGKSTIPHFTAEKLAALDWPCPPRAEQETIAAFLHRETAKIDTLIGKHEQLIATLREDRAATITQAVTKGLDPNVELKDSGVQWLGRIPQHWIACRLKHVIGSIASGTSVNGSDVSAEPDEPGVLKTSCVSAGWFNPEANKTVFEEDFDRLSCPVTAGTLIVNRANTPSLVGSSGYVCASNPNLYLSDKLWQVSFTGALAEFVHYWTGTAVYRSQIAANCVGASSSMQNLSMADFQDTAIALPPVSEQRSIVEFLSSRVSKIDALIGKATAVIAILCEYRSALITDAVTGKIDVRGWRDAAAS